MNYEEIVKIGNSVGLHETHFFASFSWWQYILYIGLFIVLMIIGLALSDSFTFDWLGAWIIALTLMIMVMFLPVTNSAYKHAKTDEKNQQEISEYKQKYGNPYIHELPVTKAETFFMKIDAEAEVTGNMILGTGAIKSELLTTMTVSYKLNGQGITETIKIVPDFDLVSGTKPYVTYQELTQDLPHYERGKYNFKIHLPENYSFTDIK